MSELEEIKQRKLEEQQLQQQVAALEQLVKTRMTKEAVQRYGNIRAANPELAIQVLALIGQFLQTGKVSMIDEQKFIEIMQRITPKKKEFKLTRK